MVGYLTVMGTRLFEGIMVCRLHLPSQDLHLMLSFPSSLYLRRRRSVRTVARRPDFALDLLSAIVSLCHPEDLSQRSRSPPSVDVPQIRYSII